MTMMQCHHHTKPVAPGQFLMDAPSMYIHILEHRSVYDYTTVVAVYVHVLMKECTLYTVKELAKNLEPLGVHILFHCHSSAMAKYASKSCLFYLKVYPLVGYHLLLKRDNLGHNMKHRLDTHSSYQELHTAKCA